VNRLIELGADVNYTVPSTNPTFNIQTSQWKTMGTPQRYDLLSSLDRHLKAGLLIGGTPLLLASWQGQVKVVQALLARGAATEAKCRLGFTSLYAAVLNGQTDVARVLLESGADPNTVANDGTNPLIQAAFQGHTKCAKLLLAHGAHIAAPSTPYVKSVDSSPQHYPLLVAVAAGSFGVLQELVKNGASVDKLVTDSSTLPPMSAVHASIMTVLRPVNYLMPKGSVDRSKRDPRRVNIERRQTKNRKKHLKCMNFVVRQAGNISASLEALSMHPQTPNHLLMIAISENETLVVETLLHHGADPNILHHDADPNTKGLFNLEGGNLPQTTALVAAAFRGYLQIVKLLVDHGAHVESESTKMGTALLAAAFQGQVEVMSYLLQSGANVSAGQLFVDPLVSQNFCMNAIFISIKAVYKPMVLGHKLPAGKDIHSVQLNGPVNQIKTKDRHLKCVRLLLKHGECVPSITIG
jgi:ankyrin repeat protein